MVHLPRTKSSKPKRGLGETLQIRKRDRREGIWQGSHKGLALAKGKEETQMGQRWNTFAEKSSKDIEILAGEKVPIGG